jgi:hypothetical protein
MFALKGIVREQREQNDCYAHGHGTFDDEEPFLFGIN